MSDFIFFKKINFDYFIKLKKKCNKLIKKYIYIYKSKDPMQECMKSYYIYSALILHLAFFFTSFHIFFFYYYPKFHIKLFLLLSH